MFQDKYIFTYMGTITHRHTHTHTSKFAGYCPEGREIHECLQTRYNKITKYLLLLRKHTHANGKFIGYYTHTEKKHCIEFFGLSPKTLEAEYPKSLSIILLFYIVVILLLLSLLLLLLSARQLVSKSFFPRFSTSRR